MVTTTPTAVGYVRVSTDDQATEGVSLEAQRQKILAYCQLHGVDLLSMEADEGLSGKRADNRPGLQQALQLVCQQRATLVVYSLSRLARSTRDCIDIADRLKRCRAGLASITEKLDTSSATGEFFFTLMAALGQLERQQIAERTTAAMSHLRRQAKRISRHIPYGFDLAADGATLLPNPDEQETIDRMQQARERGQSYHAIAARLNGQRISPKSGAAWYASSVRAVLLSAERREGAAV